MSEWIQFYTANQASEVASSLPDRPYENFLIPRSVIVPENPLKEKFLDEWIKLGAETSLQQVRAEHQASVSAQDGILCIGCSIAVPIAAVCSGCPRVIVWHEDLALRRWYTQLIQLNGLTDKVVLLDSVENMSFYVDAVFIGASAATAETVRWAEQIVPNRAVQSFFVVRPDNKTSVALGALGYLAGGIWGALARFDHMVAVS